MDLHKAENKKEQAGHPFTATRACCGHGTFGVKVIVMVMVLVMDIDMEAGVGLSG